MIEQKNKNRTRVRLAVFFVLSIHVVGLMALLMQGCRKPEPETLNTDTNAQPPSMEPTTNPAPIESNAPPPAVAPSTTEAVPAPPAAAAQPYVVSKGDTLSTIAKKMGVSIKAIEDANPNIEPTKLQIGQKLQIPAPSSTPAAVANPGPGAASSGSAGEQVYTVKSGDNLTKIASQFGTTVKAIRAENDLTTDRIKVGQKLKIPAKASAPPAAPSAPAPAPATQGTNPSM